MSHGTLVLLGCRAKFDYRGGGASCSEIWESLGNLEDEPMKPMLRKLALLLCELEL